MTQQSMWVQLMVPAVLLVVGYMLLTTKRFLVAEAGKRMSDMESSESNRMLGLAFQGQGQLVPRINISLTSLPDSKMWKSAYSAVKNWKKLLFWAVAADTPGCGRETYVGPLSSSERTR